MRVDNGEGSWPLLLCQTLADGVVASDIHVWRDYVATPDEIYRQGGQFIRRMWDASEKSGPKDGPSRSVV